MNGKRWAALGIATGLFIVSILINVLSSFAFSNVETGFSDFLLQQINHLQKKS